MGAINTATIEIIEAVLQSQGEMDNNALFTSLMNELMERTHQFWNNWHQVIPAKHHALFSKSCPC